MRLTLPDSIRAGLAPIAATPVVLVLLGLLLAAPTRAAGVHLTYVANPSLIAPGDTFTVEMTVTPGDAQFNAFDLNVSYDATRLRFVPTTPVSNQRGPLMTAACANSFHLFTPLPGLLQITYSLLCNNVFVTGPGVIYKVRFAATDSVGPTVISCAVGSQFYRAGFFVNPLDCQPLTVDVTSTSASPDPVRPAVALFLTPLPNPRHGAGAARVSFQLPRGDTARLELFDARGRRLAERPATFFSEGAHEVSWELPALASGTYFVRLSTGSGLSARQNWVFLH